VTLATIAAHLHQLTDEVDADWQQVDALMRAHPERRQRGDLLFEGHAIIAGAVESVRRAARAIEILARLEGES